ncbi:MaoC/PaaZ C-terminal domain-containing protein [Streptomyces albidus (ex Kaewkla and Franco 2022)]|uniref:MaoC family dehydratase n=1 Tax=Streptomyces albidus (ex Kaewkla and Franco 2022) TaxID=722709 RepID=UPI0015EE7420|nr:MaoC/PaaZ C-terminal domain-containing protein [Streptomyces albidus (ex Kaewkla and Franco 2022)]
MTVQHLTAPPRLPVVLARGALASPSKRGPYDKARLPDDRLVLPQAHTDPRRLRSYAEVCGFPQPGQEDSGNAPSGDGTMPPSYPHILGFPLAMRLMADRAFPFPLLGLVHTGIQLTQHRALRAHDRPEISVHAQGLSPHRRGSQFDIVTEARLAGQLVWHSSSTYLCRHHREKPSGEPARQDEQPRPLPVRDRWKLPTGLGRRYGAVSGDRNPIHLHPLTAKLFGFPRHIAHGMWTFARALAGTGAAVGCEQLTARAEFKSPVLLPSTVAFGWDEPTASAGTYRGAVQVHRFELRGAHEVERLHLTGEVTSERL